MSVRCTHCGATRREVTLWAQIIAIAERVVCCRLDVVP